MSQGLTTLPDGIHADAPNRVGRISRSTAISGAVLLAVFAALAFLVVLNASWLTRVDLAVTEEISETHNGLLNRVVGAITLLGDRIVIGSVLLAVAIWVWGSGRCRTPVAVLAGAFLVNPIIEASLKGLVGRERPDIARLVTGDGPSFPSGHVLATVGFYGVLGLIAWRSSTKRSLGVGALAASAIVIALVGFSRIYLGVHWMSDVVGGFLVGAVFVLATAWFLRGHHLGWERRCVAGGGCAAVAPEGAVG